MERLEPLVQQLELKRMYFKHLEGGGKRCCGGVFGNQVRYARIDEMRVEQGTKFRECTRSNNGWVWFI